MTKEITITLTMKEALAVSSVSQYVGGDAALNTYRGHLHAVVNKINEAGVHGTQAELEGFKGELTAIPFWKHCR